MTAPEKASDRADRLLRAIQAKKAGGGARGLDLVARPAGEPAHLGEMQRGLWFVHQLDPGSPAYNLCSAFRVRGVLDVPRLQQAFERVVSRHRLLRSTFRVDGDTARQVVHERVSLSIEHIEAEDNGGLAAAAREARRPFDLEHGPLVRVRLIEEASGHHRFLLLVLHHILADERSLGLLWKEVAQAYEGRLADTAPAVQYDDYVHWLEQADRSRRDEDLAFWRRRLDPLPDELRLPFEQPARAGSGHGRLIERTLRPSVQAGIRNLATAAGATPFMVFAFAFRLLLHRYADGQRVAFATPVSTRSHPATAEMIGYFLNPLVIATSVDEQQRVGQGVEHFCAELKALLAHASLPFDVLAAGLSPHRRADRHPVFQVMFVYQEAGPAPVLGGVPLEPITLDLGASKFDLTLFVTEDHGALRTAVEFRADRFDEVWMGGLLGHYEALLEHLPADRERRVSEVPMLDAAEERRVSAWERGPRLDGPEIDLLPPQVLDQARRQPQVPAVACGGARLSYGDLETAARAIAAALLAGGVTPGDRVGMFLDRSTQMIAGVVGSHLAGAAYVPMDPSYPDARNRDVLADADVAAVVTTSALRRRLPAGPWRSIAVDTLEHDAARSADLPGLSPGSLAYILYTSGSTGRPKGVVVTHENLRLSTRARLQCYGTPPGRFLLLPSLAFDSSVAGIFWTLATGGTLVVPTDDEATQRAAPRAPGGRTARDQPVVRPVALRRTARRGRRSAARTRDGDRRRGELPVAARRGPLHVAAARAALQRVRPHRGHRLGDGPRSDGRGRVAPGGHRASHPRRPGGGAGPARAPRAGRDPGVWVDRRADRCRRLLAARRPHRRTVRRGLARLGRDAAQVSHGRPHGLDRGRQAAVPRTRRRADQAAWVPHRARRD